MDVRKLLEKGAEVQKVSDAMPSKAEMVAAFGPGCVEEIKDETGKVTETRYYYIRDWMSDEQKLKNWNLFNEMVARARGLEVERSAKMTAERQDNGVKIIHPNGTVMTVGEHTENVIARKPGFRPLLRRKAQRWAYRNGVLVPR